MPAVADLPLRPDDALRHRRLGHEERARHRAGLQPADGAQRQRHPGILAQGRVAAREQQPEAVVGIEQAAGRGGAVHLTRLDAERDEPLPEARRASQAVDRQPPRGRRQPRAGPLRDAAARPVLERADERVLRDLLGRIPVVEDPDEPGDQPPALLADDVGEAPLDLGTIRHPAMLRAGRTDHMSGRASAGTTGRISHTSGAGQRAPHRDGRVEIGHVDDGVAADDLLRLRERPIGHRRLRRRARCAPWWRSRRPGAGGPPGSDPRRAARPTTCRSSRTARPAPRRTGRSSPRRCSR